MNDLLPPARRSIPEKRRKRMRDKLDAEITSTTTVNRRDGAARRFGIPAVAAAAVAAIAIGGYLIASNGNDGDNGIDPAGQGGGGGGQDDTRPKQQDGQQPDTAEGQSGPSTVLADPDQAYQECIDLVGGRTTDEPTGKLAIDNGKGTTVVIADSTDSYTCNIKPDHALSNPLPLNPEAVVGSFAVADNATGNALPNDPGEMVWGGGALPEGVSEVTYTFPDGHREAAVVQDGFWAVQYFSPKSFTKPGQSVFDIDPITVALDGSGGPQTLTLKWGAHTCNQVTHGC
jgi:hypothetical protein